MVKRVSKIFVLLLVVVMCLTSFYGCSDKDSKAGKTDDSSKAAGTQIPATQETESNALTGFPLDKQIELSVVILDFGRDRNTRIDQEIEKRTNIKFKWQIIPGDYAEKVNTILAAGDIPDIMPLTQDVFDRYQGQGVFVDFSKYIDKMPNFKKWSDKFSDMVDYFKTTDGNLYALNYLNTEGYLGMGWMYRKDILDKNNLKLPTTTTEVYNVLKQLKQVYPDKYPFLADNWALNDGMLMVYHTNNHIFFDIDTMQYRYGPEMSNFMDALSFSRKLYAEGLVNPDFAVIPEEQIEAKFDSGNGFLRYYWFDNYSDISNGKKVDPDFRLVAALPPVTETGLQGRVNINYATNNWWCITANAKSKYVDEIVKYLDYQMSDEFINLINWGFEGETYTVKDGQKEFILGPDAIKGMGIDGRSGIFAPMDSNVGLVMAQNKDYKDMIQLYKDNVQTIGLPKTPNIKISTDIAQKSEKVLERLTTTVNEAAAKYIMGKIDESEMRSVIKGIVDKGEYKEFVDADNAEFAKIKENFKLDYNIK